jgi:Protein of unknown function (DUF3383)
MGNINNVINVAIALNDRFTSIPSLDVEAHIVDSDLIPIDQRVRVIGVNDDLATLLGDDEAVYNFAVTYFSQTAQDGTQPDSLVLIRQTATATPPGFVFANASMTLADYTAITSGSLSFVDNAGSPHTVTVSGIDLHSCTTLASVVTALNIKLAALTSPTVVGLDDAEFSFDALGRLCVFMPATQDDTDPTIQVTFSASAGTLAYVLGVRTAEDTAAGIVAGNPIESYLDAYTAAKYTNTYFYNVTLADRITSDQGEIDAAVELATQIKLDGGQCTFVTTDTACYDANDATDLHSVLKALDNERALVIFHPYTDEYPDAAADGKFLAEEAGDAAYGSRPLANLVNESLTNGPNYSTQRSALIAKGCNFVERIDWISIFKGKTAAGKEKRMVIGADWLKVNIQYRWHAYRASVKGVLFDRVTLGAAGNIIEDCLSTLGPREAPTNGRGLLESWTMNMPQLSDWTAQNKAENHMPFLNVFRAVGTYEGHTFDFTGSINAE